MLLPADVEAGVVMVEVTVVFANGVAVSKTIPVELTEDIVLTEVVAKVVLSLEVVASVVVSAEVVPRVVVSTEVVV